MSFEAVLKVQESREDRIKKLQAEIEVAKGSYHGGRVGELEEELADLMATPSEEQLSQKYNLQEGAAPAINLGSSAEETSIEVSPQDVVREQRARADELSVMQQVVRQGAVLTREQLQQLYFGRFYDTSNMNDALEVLDLQSGNSGDKMDPEKTKELRRKANLKNLAVMFDCDNPYRQIATDFNSFFAKRNDVKVFVGEPTKELVQYVDENPEIVARVSFFVEPGAMQGGFVFPLRRITLEGMKKMLGLLVSLPPNHFQ